MENSVEQEWKECFEQLNEEERNAVLQMLKTFLKRENSPISIDEYNNEIDEALKEVDDGNYITQGEIEKRAENW